MDANGNIFIRGRLKTMILSSSGQNIFPEELETKLNNLPFILESLVIEYNKKLVALVYADYEALDSLGLNNPDNLKTIMDENLKNLNNSVAAYEKISKIQLYPTEFEKTPKRSIKRYLYNSITIAVSYTHLRAHETGRNLVCRLLLEKKKNKNKNTNKKQKKQR